MSGIEHPASHQTSKLFLSGTYPQPVSARAEISIDTDMNLKQDPEKEATGQSYAATASEQPVEHNLVVEVVRNFVVSHFTLT